MSFTIPAVTQPWHINTPILFRYLEKQYVDEFFIDGSIRISSIEQFRKHRDEQRLDKGEGRIMASFNLRDPDDGSEGNITSWILYDKKAYILSTTVIADKELMKSFNADSYIRINDSTNFGIEIAKHIPGFTAGFEGFCSYHTSKILAEDVNLNLKQFLKSPDTEPKILENSKPLPGQLDNEAFDLEKVRLFLLNNSRHLPLFMKDKSYVSQAEYRFVWLTNIEAENPIDIKIPNAIKFCTPPRPFDE